MTFWSGLILPPQEPTWHSLPGGVIELGTTGFQIRLSHDPDAPTYIGMDPEGRHITAGHNLEAMRTLMETCARWRREFDPPPGGWQTPGQPGP